MSLKVVRYALFVTIMAGLVGGCGSSSSSKPPSTILTFSSGGNYPEGIGIDESDNVWIANRFSNQLAELNSAGALVDTFDVGREPHGLKIDRGDTQNIWSQNVAGGGPGAPTCPSGTSGTVTALKADGTLIGSFCTDGNAPQHAQFDSSGNVWVTNQGSNTVSELSGSTGAFISSFATGVNPHAIAKDASGNFWIGNYYSGTVTVLKPDGSLFTTIQNVGLEPTGNSIDPSGNLWQSVQSLNVVATFAAAPNFAPGLTEDVGLAPRGVTIDKNGTVFVANRSSNEVIEFNFSGVTPNGFNLNGTPIQTIRYPVGGCPENMAVDSRGDLWVTNSCSNTVSEILGVAVPSPNSDDDSNG